VRCLVLLLSRSSFKSNTDQNGSSSVQHTYHNDIALRSAPMIFAITISPRSTNTSPSKTLSTKPSTPHQHEPATCGIVKKGEPPPLPSPKKRRAYIGYIQCEMPGESARKKGMVLIERSCARAHEKQVTRGEVVGVDRDSSFHIPDPRDMIL
jgi:hypothetical protein